MTAISYLSFYILRLARLKEKFEGLGAGINYTVLFENNIDYDPSFINAALDNFLLSDFSPCIRTGIDSVEIAEKLYRMPILCAGGNFRPSPIGTKPDIGACENLLGSLLLNENELTNIEVFFLSQNYPNPFNRTTSIQYSVSSRQFVTLKVYDVLGNEIETIVNEEKLEGVYELKWSATQLPSGIYLYQLKAEIL